MTPIEIQWREPETFAAGDTLAFNRKLPHFLPSAGWAIQLTVSKALPQGGAAKLAQVMSIPDLHNAYHCFAVANFLAGQPTGQYILSEEVINAANAEQHQIYYNDNFMVGPNLVSGAAGQIKNPYEIILEKALAKLTELEDISLQETDQQRTRFLIEQRTALLERIKFYEAKVANLRNIARAANGQSPNNIQEPVFNIG